MQQPTITPSAQNANNGMMAAAPTEHQRLVSLGHLEHQLAASKALGNQDEYKEWLRTYANALGEQVAMRPQLTGAVHELCDELLGPLDVAEKAEGKEGVWSPKVIGLSKRELLRDVVLPSLATNRSLQRILEEYIEQLAAVSS